MKKFLSLLALALLAVTSLSLSSCSKDNDSVTVDTNPLSGTCWDNPETISEMADVQIHNYLIFTTNYFYSYQTITTNGSTVESCTKHQYSYDSETGKMTYLDDYGLTDLFNVKITSSKLTLYTSFASTEYTKATQPKSADELDRLIE